MSVVRHDGSRVEPDELEQLANRPSRGYWGRRRGCVGKRTALIVLPCCGREVYRRVTWWWTRREGSACKRCTAARRTLPKVTTT